MLVVSAPAKINLHLHITGRRDSGYHDLDSLVVFADISDRLSFSSSDLPRLDLKGEFGEELKKSTNDNSVAKAARMIAEKLSRPSDTRIELEKNIPMGAGLGGGSSDAATCLLGLNRLWGDLLSKRDLAEIALKIGADVPSCLQRHALVMRGIGEEIEIAPALPALHSVLIWPGCAAPTADIYKNLEMTSYSDEFAFRPRYGTAEDLIADLEETRNDLQKVSVRLFPVIGEAIAELKKTGSCRFARMSGSGSSVFGIFDSPEAAQNAAEKLSRSRPEWWVKYSCLNRE